MKNKISLIIIVLLILIGGFSLWSFFNKDLAIRNSVSSFPDVANNPAYSNHDFCSCDSVINIGIQPMYMPTGIIMEVLKRDNILNEELKKLNIRIEYFSFSKGADVNHFMEKGLIHAGVGGDMPALMAGSTVDIIIPIILQKGNASVISDKPMLSSELKGKKIAYPYGSIAHYFILELLNNENISEEDVELVSMDLDKLSNALNSNEIDLFSAWEPIVAASCKSHAEFFVVYQKISTGYLYFLKSLAKKKPEVVKYILAAIVRSIRWMKANPQNLILASKWNGIEISKFTGIKCSLNDEERAELALKDILRYYSKYEVVIKDKDLSVNSELFKEFHFLQNLDSRFANTDWKQVSEKFDNKLITFILEHPQHYKLSKFNYAISQ